VKIINIYKRVSAKHWQPGQAFHSEYSITPSMHGEKPWRLLHIPDGWTAEQDASHSVQIRDEEGGTVTLSQILYCGTK
jgi:hypothetical protein